MAIPGIRNDDSGWTGTFGSTCRDGRRRGCRLVVLPDANPSGPSIFEQYALWRPSGPNVTCQMKVCREGLARSLTAGRA